MVGNGWKWLGMDRKWFGMVGNGWAHRTTDRADDRDARGEVTRDRNTKNSRRPVLLRTTQRPRSANDEISPVMGTSAHDRNPWWFDFPRSISETRKVQSCYVARRK